MVRQWKYVYLYENDLQNEERWNKLHVETLAHFILKKWADSS